ncbi:MAG: HEAT repeat domain-containing protein, partial [Phycisphaeraceae bacterium]|nr:HEAT repeat domain-containing protein [Phycisphaeraceae bacterium]
DETALVAFKTFHFWEFQNDGIDAFERQTRQNRTNRDQFVPLVADSWSQDPYLVEKLSEFLTDTSPAMRVAACKSVETLARRRCFVTRSVHPENAIVELVSKLRSDPDSDVRAAAETAWRALPNAITP